MVLGWLTYILVKWRLHPTQDCFDRLPHFMQPTDLQTCQAHPSVIDGIIWPQMRDNFIKAGSNGQGLHHVLRALCPAMKLTWPKNTPLLEPQGSGGLVMRSDFPQTFTQLENWSISPEFARDHPDLVTGMTWVPIPNNAFPSSGEARPRLRIVPSA